jgi:hypothetical protein
MRDYSRVSPLFWTRGTGKRLRGERDAKLLALYLLTCPVANMIGVYYLPQTTMSHEAGMSAVELAQALEVLRSEGFAFYDPQEELVWVPNMASFQVGDTLKPADKRRFGVLAELAKVAHHPFSESFWKKYATAYSLGQNPFKGAAGDTHADSCVQIPTPSKPSPDTNQPPRSPLEGVKVEAPSKPLGSPLEGVTETPATPSKPIRPRREEQEQAQEQAQEQGPRRWSKGDTICAELLPAYESGIREATGKGFALDPSKYNFDIAPVLAAVNAHAKAKSAPDAIEWVRRTAARWVNVTPDDRAQFTAGWATSKFLAWLNSGADEPAAEWKPHRAPPPEPEREPEDQEAARQRFLAMDALLNDAIAKKLVR